MDLLFSTVNSMKSKGISNISNENLASKLKYAANIRFISDFEDLVQTSDIKMC